jgi:hypothetical protein
MTPAIRLLREDQQIAIVAKVRALTFTTPPVGCELERVVDYDNENLANTSGVGLHRWQPVFNIWQRSVEWSFDSTAHFEPLPGIDLREIHRLRLLRVTAKRLLTLPAKPALLVPIQRNG